MPKYIIDYTFHGRSEHVVDSDETIEEVKARIDKRLNDDDAADFIDPTTIDTVDFEVREMHPVTRDGRELWTTYVRDGDVRGHANV